jgi:2-dehydro-3-deoxygalactonokinase
MTAFIGIDWGTSNARFMLINAEGTGTLVEERSAQGVSRLAGAETIEATCFEMLSGWPHVPVVMAGMVGSNIGWRPAPYAKTPVTSGRATAIRFDVRDRQFALLAGVETVRADGFLDVMRGEETQIFGGIGSDSALVCLPGTHSKWAVVSDGAITDFHTAMTGELIDIIGRSSILLNPKRAPSGQPSIAFAEGVAAVKASALGLETLLFTVRSRQIVGTLSAEAADSYLAGLCIAADIRSALTLHVNAPSVALIGSPALTALYASALAHFGVPSRQIDGREAVLAGLTIAYRAIFA